MSRLHTLLVDTLDKVPMRIFARFLREKADAVGTPLSVEDSEALAEHMVNNRSGEFRIEDGGEERVVDLKVTAEELQGLLKEIEAFDRDELPHLITKAVETSAKVVLESRERDWPAQKAHEHLNLAQFRKNLEGRWGAAFDILRMMYTISIEIGQDVAKRWRRPTKTLGALRHVLLHLHARACQITYEIICLMENGFADGAMARWRTLHEISVVATLISEHGNDLARRYLAHEAVEAKRALDRFSTCYEGRGYEPLSEREVKSIERDYADSLEVYGHNFGSQYGWAAHHLARKKPRFDDLEAAAGQILMRSDYNFASFNVHATTKGIMFRLGLMDDGGITALAGASNAGFLDPAQNTAQALVEVTSLLLARPSRFDDLIELEILLILRDRLPSLLQKANRQLERDHRAYLKSQIR